MARGGRGGFPVWASLALAALLAPPGALADTAQAPVEGDAYATYTADLGAVLAAAQAYDPRFDLTFDFARATVYHLDVRGAPTSVGTLGDRAPAVPAAAPTLLAAESLGPGGLRLDPARDASVLLFTDLAGLGWTGLPVASAGDAARFAVETAAPFAGALDDGSARLDPHDLLVEGGVRYALDGLALQDPVRATVDGDLYALITRGALQAADTARELGAAGTDRVLLVRADDARVAVQATGLTAILHLPEASLGVGGQVIADVAGQRVGAAQDAGVASGADGLQVAADAALLGALLGPDPATGAGYGPEAASAGAYEALDAQAAMVGALLGGAVVLLAAAAAGLWAGGKHALLGLLAPLYARLQHDEVLHNGAREALYRHVVEHPGVNVSELVKRFGLGWGATVYHLRVLERNHLVTASKQGRQVCYFQNGGRYHGQMAGISALRNANAALLARTILAEPGLAQRDLCRRTALAQPTVSWHLQRLEEAGLIVAEGAPRKRYTALPALAGLAERGFLAPAAPPAPGTPPAGVPA